MDPAGLAHQLGDPDGHRRFASLDESPARSSDVDHDDTCCRRVQHGSGSMVLVPTMPSFPPVMGSENRSSGFPDEMPQRCSLLEDVALGYMGEDDVTIVDAMGQCDASLVLSVAQDFWCAMYGMADAA